MTEHPMGADAKAKMTFDYYKQERDEFANLSRERTSLSLQLLVILGALSYAFFQAGSVAVKWGISGVVVILGLIGLITNMSLESEMRVHVARARAARKSISFLQDSADAKPGDHQSSKGIRQGKLYVALMVGTMLVGLLYALTIILEWGLSNRTGLHLDRSNRSGEVATPFFSTTCSCGWRRTY